MVKTLLNISKHGTEEKEDGLVIQSGMNEVKHETSILIRFLFGYVQFKFNISLHCVLWMFYLYLSVPQIPVVITEDNVFWHSSVTHELWLGKRYYVNDVWYETLPKDESRAFDERRDGMLNFISDIMNLHSVWVRNCQKSKHSIFIIIFTVLSLTILQCRRKLY